MRFTVESAELAQHIAGLLALDERVGTGDLDAALRAHAVALDLVDEILSGQARLQRVPANATRAEIERNPVADLARQVREHPRVLDGAPSDVLRRDADSPVRDLWIGVAAHAAGAQLAWERDAIKTRQSPAQAWATVADAAAIAACLARLDRDLASQLSARGDRDKAKRFRQSASMQTVAGVTLDLARSGPLDSVAALEAARPHPVVFPLEVLQAQHTTARLLGEATSLRPTDVIRVASSQMQIAGHLGHQLEAVDPDLAVALTDFASLLDPAATQLPMVASIHPGNRAAAVQCRQTYEGVRQLRDPVDLTIAAVGFLGGVRPVVDALRDSVVDHESRGAWLHETTMSFKYRWQRRFIVCSRLSASTAQASAVVSSDERYVARQPPEPPRPSRVLPTWVTSETYRPTFPVVGVAPTPHKRPPRRRMLHPRDPNGRFSPVRNAD